MLNRKSNILNRYGMVFVAMRHEVGIKKTPLSGRVLTQGRIKKMIGYGDLFFQQILQLYRFIGGDEIYFTIDQPFHVIRLVHSPGIHFHAQIMAFPDPFGMFAEYCVMIVRPGTS